MSVAIQLGDSPETCDSKIMFLVCFVATCYGSVSVPAL